MNKWDKKKVSIAEPIPRGRWENQIFQSQLSDFFQLIFINKHPLEFLGFSRPFYAFAAVGKSFSLGSPENLNNLFFYGLLDAFWVTLHEIMEDESKTWFIFFCLHNLIMIKTWNLQSRRVSSKNQTLKIQKTLEFVKKVKKTAPSPQFNMSEW